MYTGVRDMYLIIEKMNQEPGKISSVHFPPDERKQKFVYVCVQTLRNHSSKYSV